MKVRLVADDWWPVLNVSDVEADDDGYEVPDDLVARWRAAEKELDEAVQAIHRRGRPDERSGIVRGDQPP